MEGDRIAGLRSHEGSLISVYASRPSPGGFAALLSDLVRPVRDRASSLGRDVEKSVRADTERIRDLADGLEMEAAPGYAIFASALNDTFVLEPLGHQSPNVSTIGPRPYMRPLRAAPRALRSGIIVADNQVARTFSGLDGHVDEVGDALEAERLKASWGGFSGYDEHNVRARAGEVSNRLWREAAERLLKKHMERPFDYIVVGSRPELADEVGGELHPYLSRLQRVTILASPQGLTSSALRTEITSLDAEVRKQRHEAMAGRVCDTAWSGGNAVLGLQAVITAANRQAVEGLFVAGEFTRPGVLCDSCGHLARTGDSCPVCGSQLFEVDDVVGAVMDSVVAGGGSVTQITVASPLDVDGIGALTRFPVPV